MNNAVCLQGGRLRGPNSPRGPLRSCSNYPLRQAKPSQAKSSRPPEVGGDRTRQLERDLRTSFADNQRTSRVPH